MKGPTERKGIWGLGWQSFWHFWPLICSKLTFSTPYKRWQKVDFFGLLSPFYYKTGTMGRIGNTRYVLPTWLLYRTLNRVIRVPLCKNLVLCVYLQIVWYLCKFFDQVWLQMKMSHLSRSGSLLSLINLCRQSWELNFPALFLCCMTRAKPYMNSYSTHTVWIGIWMTKDQALVLTIIVYFRKSIKIKV